MIDWLAVVAHSFWIAGLALVLAALSYHYWLAGQSGLALRKAFAALSFQKAVVFGLLLVSIGLAGTSDQWWQTALAAVAVLACAGLLVMLFRPSA